MSANEYLIILHIIREYQAALMKTKPVNKALECYRVKLPGAFDVVKCMKEKEIMELKDFKMQSRYK